VVEKAKNVSTSMHFSQTAEEIVNEEGNPNLATLTKELKPAVIKDQQPKNQPTKITKWGMPSKNSIPSANASGSVEFNATKLNTLSTERMLGNRENLRTPV